MKVVRIARIGSIPWRSDLSDALDQSRFRFEFKVTEDDDRLFRKLVTKNLEPFAGRGVTMGVRLLSLALLFFPTLVALDRGWLPLSAALLSLLAFVMGSWVQPISNLLAVPRLYSRLFEWTRAGQATWHLIFDDGVAVVRRKNVESRIPWDAISALQVTESIVVFWFDARSGFYIPARAFADASSRTTFTEWATERVRSAAASAVATVGGEVSLQPE